LIGIPGFEFSTMIAASFNALFPEHEASKATARPKDFIACDSDLGATE
jgi:hypothetical protein